MSPVSRSNSYLPIYLILGLAILYVSSVNAELKLVNVIFRHGDRAPDNTANERYPNDPYLNDDFYPEGRGQLTNQGKMREYKLGQFLRNRYLDFLGSVYVPGSVFAVSSDYDRTKMSLQLVLAGLFPPAKIQKWNKLLDWQPVPTKYKRLLVDNMFLADECPSFLAEYDRALYSQEGLSRLSEFDDLMDKLTIWTGKNISTPWDMFYLYHTLMAEYSMNLKLPDWAYTVFPYGELWNGTVFAYEIASATPLLRKLDGGSYLRVVTETMTGFVKGALKDPRKMYLYGGHETNIAAVLAALDLYYPHVPEYSSSLVLELHEEEDGYYVKLLHYLGIPSIMNELRLPNCDVMCPLEDFLEITADVIPSDQDLICDKTLTAEYAKYKSPQKESLLTYNLIRAIRGLGDL